MPDTAQCVNACGVGRQQVGQFDFDGFRAMVAAHFEQVGNVVNAEPSGQPYEPLISLVLDADPAIHVERCRGNLGAERGCARTRTRAVQSGVAAAAASGNLVTGRDSSRGRHSQLIEYRKSFVTADSETRAGTAGAAPVLSSLPVAADLLPIKHA